MRITAQSPLGQILDADYLGTILAEFDAFYGADDLEWIPPKRPERPDPPSLWRRVRAEVARWLALATLKSPVFPPLIGDIILESAETWAVETGHYD